MSQTSDSRTAAILVSFRVSVKVNVAVITHDWEALREFYVLEYALQERGPMLCQHRIHGIPVPNEQRWHTRAHIGIALRYAAFCSWPGITPICLSMPIRS